MNNIEYLNQRISDLEKENNRLKNAIIHLVKDFPNLEESVVQENRESAEVRPLPEVKVLFPNFKRYSKELADLVKIHEHLFKDKEKEFIKIAQRIVNPTKKQNDWLEAIHNKFSEQIEIFLPSKQDTNPFYNEEDPLDF